VKGRARVGGFYSGDKGGCNVLGNKIITIIFNNLEIKQLKLQIKFV